MTSATFVASRALHDAVAALFRGTSRSGPPTVGIEQELIPFRRADHGRVPIHRLRAALRGLPYLGFEPGGQIELSPPPRASVTAACEQLAELLDEVERRLAEIGVAAVATGLNPWHTVEELGLQVRSARYESMDAHLQRIGPAGRMFMRQTAATQICIGLRPGAEGLQQWRTAILMAPVLAALFANAPQHQGGPTEHPGARTAICRAADPDRSRHHDPPAGIEDYVRFAHAAPRLDCYPVGAEEEHLSTLFPPVRPRSTYLELRALDAQPIDRLPTAVALVACLLDERSTAAAAEEICATAGPADLWDAAAGEGLAAAEIGDLAIALVDLAIAASRRTRIGYLPRDSADHWAGLVDQLAAHRSRRPLAGRHSGPAPVPSVPSHPLLTPRAQRIET